AAAAAAATIAGCGSSNGHAQRAPAVPPPPPGLAPAEHAAVADFPSVGKRTLQQLASPVHAGAKAGFATSILVPGRQLVAFDMLGPDNRFLYGKSALYVARTPGDRARGPYPAPADPMTVAPAFLSRTAAEDSADI